jgi:hypothetical protein
MANFAKPQCKQTKTFGNTKPEGLSRASRTGKPIRQPQRHRTSKPRATHGPFERGAEYHSGHHSLLLTSAPFAKRLPTMRLRRAAWVQLLPSLQLQAGPELSAMPARGWDKRHLLSLLRNPAAQSNGPGLQPSNASSHLAGHKGQHKSIIDRKCKLRLDGSHF